MGTASVRLPLILQNPRPQDFYGPEDYMGGDPLDEARAIEVRQQEWDAAYAQLSLRQRIVVWWGHG